MGLILPTRLKILSENIVTEEYKVVRKFWCRISLSNLNFKIINSICNFNWIIFVCDSVLAILYLNFWILLGLQPVDHVLPVKYLLRFVRTLFMVMKEVFAGVK